MDECMDKIRDRPDLNAEFEQLKKRQCGHDLDHKFMKLRIMQELFIREIIKANLRIY